MHDNLHVALEALPHGPEFRFLDRIISLVPGKSGTAEYLLKGTEEFLSGHFPDDPLMPGVLLIEGVAQLAGVIAQSDPNHALLADLKLAAVRGAKITGTARPLETIIFSVEVTGRMANLVQAHGTASVDGKVVLQTEVTLAGADVP